MTGIRAYQRELGLLVVLAAVMVAMSLLSPYFLDGENLLDLTRHLSEAGIIACGMTLIIMTGGIDLSVGSLLGLAGIVLGYAWQSWGAAPAVACALATGVVAGGLNGLLITRWNLPPLVVTLATMALFRGGAYIISKAQPVSNFPDAFAWIGQGYLGPVPIQLLLWVLITAGTAFLAMRTPVGRFTMAIGDNERAARFAAVPIVRIKMWLYTGTGLLSALAAIIFTSRVSTAKADAGLGLELEVITGVVLGGTLITGGRGTVLGSFIGVLILGVVRNGLSLAGVSSVWQVMLAGCILIGTAILNERVASKSAGSSGALE